MTEPFFLVWCPTSHRPPTVKHPTSEAASAEAKRLAEANVEQDFHVLQYVGTARAPKSKANYSQAATDEVAVKAPDIPKLKLEVGKFYRTVEGDKVGPISDAGDGAYMQGSDGWIEHNGSNVNPAPGANVEWIIADERQAKHYIYAFNRSEDVLWSCVVAYRVVEAAKPTRALKHGEYQVGDRVRYTARAADVGDLSRVGAVGVATDVKSYAVEVKWDDGITRPRGPLPKNIEHESLPQFRVGDLVVCRDYLGSDCYGHVSEVLGGRVFSDNWSVGCTFGYFLASELQLVRPAAS